MSGRRASAIWARSDWRMARGKRVRAWQYAEAVNDRPVSRGKWVQAVLP